MKTPMNLDLSERDRMIHNKNLLFDIPIQFLHDAFLPQAFFEYVRIGNTEYRKWFSNGNINTKNTKKNNELYFSHQQCKSYLIFESRSFDHFIPANSCFTFPIYFSSKNDAIHHGTLLNTLDFLEQIHLKFKFLIHTHTHKNDVEMSR